MKTIKTRLFDEKQQENVKKIYVKKETNIIYWKLAPLTCDVTAQNFRE